MWGAQGSRPGTIRGKGSWAPPRTGGCVVGTLEAALRKAREGQGITRRELAARTGLSAATIAAYETGLRRPRKRSLVRIARALSSDDTTAERLLALGGCESQSRE